MRQARCLRPRKRMEVSLVLALGVALALSGCRDSPVGTEEESTVNVESATVTSAPGAVFRTLRVVLDGEEAVVVDYAAADVEGLRVESDQAATVHELVLPRLRAGRDYTFEVRVGDASPLGPPDWVGSFATDPLPDEVAAVRTTVEGEATFPLLFLEVGRPTGPHLPLVIDTRGEVVWYSLHPGRAASGFTLLEDSLFAFNTAEGVRVISPRSQELVAELTRERGAARTGIDPFHIHHDVTATPSGTLLFLALDPTEAADTVWMGEAVWEWDPRSDQLHRRWTSDDFLDPATDRGPRSRPGDWLHANGLAVGPRGNVLVSLFWLHEVLSIAPDWGSVEWRLGGPASSFQGVGEAMEAGQHTPAEVAPDRILLFDNGLDRAEGQFSRALEIELDRTAGTAEVVWEFRPTPDIFAPIVSSVNRLPNGHTFVNFGLAEGLFGGASSGPLVFFEVTPTGEIGWSMAVEEGAELVYRATPIGTVGGERPPPPATSALRTHVRLPGGSPTGGHSPDF